METMDKINMDGAACIDKIRRGEILTKQEHSILKIYNSIYSNKAFNSGKRKVIKTGK